MQNLSPINKALHIPLHSHLNKTQTNSYNDGSSNKGVYRLKELLDTVRTTRGM